ncbi:hypothetical protein [Paraburkholderia solisilvae]|uniref:hypothetical protein n=1 Tax=Paraburkholderia solisilvae TaxID=624376 RepID=UPI0035EA24D1
MSHDDLMKRLADVTPEQLAAYLTMSGWILERHAAVLAAGRCTSSIRHMNALSGALFVIVSGNFAGRHILDTGAHRSDQ